MTTVQLNTEFWLNFCTWFYVRESGTTVIQSMLDKWNHDQQNLIRKGQLFGYLKYSKIDTALDKLITGLECLSMTGILTEYELCFKLKLVQKLTLTKW